VEKRFSTRPCVVIFVATAFLILSTFPVVIADANNHFAYSGAVDSPYSNSGSFTLTYSNDGSFVAVGFHSSVGIFETSSRTFVRNIDVGDGVRSIAFSGDDSIMFVGLESPMLETVAVALFHTDDWQRFGVVDDGLEVDSISTLESEQMFAAANEVKGVNEYQYDNPAHSSATYDGVHTSRATCVDYSPSGNHLLTGSEDGSIAVWNRVDQTVHLSWLSDDPIEDCGFSASGDTVTWITASIMQVRAMPSGDFLTTISLNGPAKQFEWNGVGNELWVMTEVASPLLQVFQLPQMNVINTFELGHDAQHFALSPSEDEFIVATLSSIVTIYSDIPWRPGYGQPGVDGDMDGIPDSLDPDDDGDGISDEYEFVCNEGHDCQTNPNLDYIRSIQISFSGSTMTILDSVQLNSSQSAPLRILAASSVTPDNLVDDGETLRMERMLCGGTDSSTVTQSWIDAIGLELTAVIDYRVICDAKSGLIDTVSTNSKTRIIIRWFIEVELSNKIPRPFNLTFTPGISPPASTVAMATPSSPIRLTVIYEGETEYVSGAIYPTDPTLSINILAPEPPQPSVVEISIEWMTENYWAPILVLVIVPLIFIVGVRRRNRILFEVSDDEEMIVTRRRKSHSTQAILGGEDELLSSTGRRQPSAPPTIDQSRPQPNRPPPDQRAIRKVRKTPGAVVQSGEAPEGESWDYGEHGAYWDTDDPDQQDPYGESKDFHDEELELKQLAEQMVDSSSPSIEEDDGQETTDFADAISKLTEGGMDAKHEADEKPAGIKKRGAPKRRAPKRRKKT